MVLRVLVSVGGETLSLVFVGLYIDCPKVQLASLSLEDTNTPTNTNDPLPPYAHSKSVCLSTTETYILIHCCPSFALSCEC